VTDAELDRIEERLGIRLPDDYRALTRDRADELKGLKWRIGGSTYGWFDELLYLDADQVVDTNLIERQPDAGTESAFPGWSDTFFLIGDDGSGNYYALRLQGDRKVWMIGSDCDEPSALFDSLAEYVDEQVRLYHEQPPWQPPPALSSFDDSCPLADRFGLYIGAKACEVECQESDRPLTEQKLTDHGIDVQALSSRVRDLVAVLARCDPATMTIEPAPKPSSSGSLVLRFSPPHIADPRFEVVGANIFKGNVYVSLHGPQDDAPPPEAVGIDWTAFRTAVAGILQTLSPPGTRVSVSEARPSRFDLSEQWNYDLSYTLEPA